MKEGVTEGRRRRNHHTADTTQRSQCAECQTKDRSSVLNCGCCWAGGLTERCYLQQQQQPGGAQTHSADTRRPEHWRSLLRQSRTRQDLHLRNKNQWMKEEEYLSSVLVFFVTFVSLDMTFSKHDQLRARYCWQVRLPPDFTASFLHGK